MTARQYDPDQVVDPVVVACPPCPDCKALTTYDGRGTASYTCTRCGGRGVWCNLPMHATTWPGKRHGDPSCFNTWTTWSRGARPAR